MNAIASDAAPRGGILVPGRNCWRLAPASRFAVATTAPSQALALRQALLAARSTVFIVGWHVDSQTLLRGPEPDGWPERLGELLHALLIRRPALRVYVLAWDFCMLYSAQMEWPPVYRQAWPAHRRLVHRLDACHPTGGAHHQNFVVIDDALAFVGGLDLARDTRGAQAGEGDAGLPASHDLGAQAVFDGAAAQAMGELARRRWQRATGRRVALGVQGPGEAPWPPSLLPDLYDVAVGISRTEPAYAGQPGAAEIRQLYLDVIRGARGTLYLENGYFTSRAIGEALAGRLADPDPPAVALVTQQAAAGWLDETAMQRMRAQLHHDLRAADAGGRYRAFAPVADPEAPVATVRSKLLIADDDLVTLGSANFNNRSMTLDTECQVTVESLGDPAAREAIAAIRHRILAVHLGVPAATVAEAEAGEGAAAAVRRLDPAGAALADFSPPPTEPPETVSIAWLDNERPVSPDRLIAQFMSDVAMPSRARRTVLVAGSVGALLLLGGLWQWTPLSDYLNLGMLLKMGYALKSLPYAALAVIACYVVGGLIAMPITVLIAASGMVFGAWQGGLYAVIGTMLSALVTYGVGRWLGRDTVRRLAGARINALSRRIAARGILAMVVLRVLPVAPFTMVNVMAGASHIGLRDYLLGTFIGMVPGIILTVAFANQLAQALEHPDIESVSIVVAAGLVLMGVAVGVQRVADALAARRRREEDEVAGHGTIA